MRTRILASLLLCACGHGGAGAPDPDTDGGTETGGMPTGDDPAPDTSVPDDSDVPNDLGPPPEGEFERVSDLEIRNDLELDRVGETAYSAIPVPRELALTDLSGLAVIDDDGRWRQAQFTPIARWGGPLSDASAPVRWLAVAVQAHVDANAAATYELRRYAELPDPEDPLAVEVEDDGATITVDTAAAVFTLDRERPGLLQRIELDGAAVFDANDHGEAGPRLELEDGTQPDAVLDTDGVEVIEAGPVRVVVQAKGHFVGNHPDVQADCAFDGQPYPRFGYTAVLTFTRGSRDIDVQFQLRNECSDAFSEPWTDQAVVVAEASWVQPLAVDGRRYYAAGDAVAETDDNVVVEQRKSEPLGGGRCVGGSIGRGPRRRGGGGDGGNIDRTAGRGRGRRLRGAGSDPVDAISRAAGGDGQR